MGSLGQERPLKPVQQFSSFQGIFDSSQDLGLQKELHQLKKGLGQGKELSKDWGNLRDHVKFCP